MHIIGGKSVNNGLNKTPIDVDRVHYAIRLVETHNSAENRQKTKKSLSTRKTTFVRERSEQNKSIFMEEKSRKPEDTPFKQQRLKAWQPILTPNWVIGTFFVVGLIFIPIGVVLHTESENVRDSHISSEFIF